MSALNSKRILLGVTAGISAYKAAILVRALRQQGSEVKVVMTKHATQFVGPLTFQSLSGQPVLTNLFDLEVGNAMGHIEVARWADLVIIAPASADFIAHFACGFANDLLSTLCLATDAPIVLAPAMNQQMWANQATQENIAKLKKRQITIAGPARGDQACGEYGFGRLLEPEEIVLKLATFFKTSILAGVKVLITAGPTREAIDPVRYISNRSSGRMGYAIAHAALEAGASVRLVSGPVAGIVPPERAQLTSVDSADEMHQAVMQSAKKTDIFIANAAVTDFRSANISAQKIKKATQSSILPLLRNADILADVAALEHAPFTVGFAAETNNLEKNACEKLKSKNIDMIAANDVGHGKGFESDQNALTVFWKTEKKQLHCASKKKIARQLIQLIAERYNERHQM